MKKLFACLVALLAMSPVVANAASYTKGDYINFAGNDDDWSAFKNNGDQYLLDHTGNGTIYLEDSEYSDGEGHKYLKVLNLFNVFHTSVLDNPTATIKGSSLYNLMLKGEGIDNIRLTIKKPYGYGATDDGVDLDVASAADIKALFGVTNLNDTVTLKDDVKTFFSEIILASTKDTVYFATSTAGTVEGHLLGLKVVKSGNEIQSITYVDFEDGADSNANYTLFSVLYMNEAYVCSAGTEETYSCYECPTTGDQTEYVWKVTGSQDAACKVVDTVTTKSKCAKNAKTGVDSYLIPAAIILGVCAIVLIVVKRKDAFRAI